MRCSGCDGQLAVTTSSLTKQWRIIAAIAKALRGALLVRMDIQGLEHVPENSGAVVAFNHYSYADFVALGWAIVIGKGRPIRFIGKQEIWDSRLVGWAPRSVDAIPVVRGSAASRAAAFDAAVAALRNGDLVVVAPEQTISPSFDLLPFRTGAARMAIAANTPIIPVAGWGTHRWATKGVRPRLRLRLPVTVRFEAPIYPEETDDAQQLTSRLEQIIAASLDKIQRTYPDGAPSGAWWVPHRLGGTAPTHAAVLADHRERQRRWNTDRPD